MVRGLGTRQGFWTLVFLRLIPVMPFSALNFGFGATPLSARTYALASLAGSFPTCLGFAIAGAWLGGLR
jgi:uncharacterized membrane protein YdjX (TVP38/TMEM64 family)